MKTPIFTLIALFFILISSCKEKDLPTDMTGAPVFQVVGQVDGSPLEITAGNDGYYMRSFYDYDVPHSIFVLGGEISQPGCTDCSEKLIVLIRDEEMRAETDKVDIEKATLPGTYTFRDFQSEFTGFETRFQALTDPLSSYSFHWDLGNGDSSDQETFVYDYGNLSGSSYTVKLAIETQSGCKSEITRTITVPNKACQPKFSEVPSPTSPVVFFNAIPSGMPPYTYNWNFGDGTPGSNLPQPKHTFPSRGVFNVCLEIEDANQCKSQFCKNVVAGNVDACPVNFVATTKEVTTIDSIAFSRVTVIWEDKSGKVFRSDQLPQTAASNFSILSSTAYEVNETGLPSQKLDVVFGCDLWAGNGDRIRMENVKATIAVAIPL